MYVGSRGSNAIGPSCDRRRLHICDVTRRWKFCLMTTLTLILTLRPHDAIVINADKQQGAMSEVDLKSKVGCFLPKSPQVV